jgi:CDP-glucose 4,6-dehydratase
MRARHHGRPGTEVMHEMRKTTSEFWANRNVLITGHSGFKGGWLSIWLKSMGANVKGISLPPESQKSLFESANVKDGMVSVFLDIRNYEDLCKHIKDFEPDIVFHMAAQPLVRYSYSNPIETYSVNVMGTVNLLEACRHCPSVKAIVNITTDKCYKNNEWVWGYRENEPMGGHDPYSSSKGCAELVTSAFRSSYFFGANDPALASVRAGNVIGGGDWSQDRLIPDIVRALVKRETLVIRHPGAIRPWQHVLEPLSGYLMLAEKMFYEKQPWSGAWNFGPNDFDVKPVSWIVDRMIMCWESDLCCEFGNNDLHEAHYLKLDISKSKQLMRWEPRWNIEQAVDKIVEWYKLEEAGECMASACIAQIDEFINATDGELNNA